MSENVCQYQTREQEAPARSYGDSGEDLFRRALAAHGDKRRQEAARLYREILAGDPDHLPARFNLATICHACGDLAGAISSYRLVLAAEPENFQVLYLLAGALRDQGCREEAIVGYQQTIEVDATQADAHFNLGLLLYQQGELDRAADCYRAAVRLDPAHADSLYNLGIIHFERREYAQAAASYEQALAARPADVDTLYNLAFTRARQGQLAPAALHYHAALELAPDDAELHNALGTVLRKLHEPELAEACYRRAVDLRPGFGSAWSNLATILHFLERDAEACDCYRRAMALGDRSESAAYMLTALGGGKRQAPPPSYVRELFDGYAEDFDRSLVDQLEYRLPEMLQATCRELAGTEHRFRRAVDLGCGTGLAGGQFRERVEHLTGVDLSGKMLAKAAERGIYDRLCCKDIADFLAGEAAADFDLVLAADVLIYLGALEPFFEQVGRCLAPGGYLLFSTERWTGNDDYVLQKTGRYAHSEGYVRKLAAGHGFEVEVCREIELRKEKNQWLRGCLLALRRAGS